MQKVHDFLWPNFVITNNYWQERMFRAHCEDNRLVVLASGGGIGKSDVCARIAIIFWLADPTGHAVIISSTTLDSLEKRIWGYVVKNLSEIALPFPYEFKRAKPPKIVYPGQKHELTGIFTAALREGEDERTLATAVGKHPERGLLVFLDEAPFISPHVVDAIPNWERGTPWFQLFAMGNSDSTHDLHGSLAKPRDGWDSINPTVYEWPTCQERGVCLYFNPHDSPAIHEKDPVRKAALSKFLVTAKTLQTAKDTYGIHSDKYYRQILGFWKQSSIDEVIITKKRLEESNVYAPCRFSGLYPLEVVGGLDPAIDDKSRGCVLRFGFIGHTIEGLVVLDLRSEYLIHYVDTSPTMEKSAELQLADNVIALLKQFKCPLGSLAIDATGMGRAVGELIKLRMQTNEDPIKVVSRRGVASGKDKDHSLHTRTPLEMWDLMAEFISNKQLRGLDILTGEQLCNRMVKTKAGKRNLETKEDFKVRIAASNPALAVSPNEADAAALALQAAVIRHGLRLGETRPTMDENYHSNLKYRTFLIEQEKQRSLDNPLSNVLKEPRRVGPTANFKSGLENVIWQKNK